MHQKSTELVFAWRSGRCSPLRHGARAATAAVVSATMLLTTGAASASVRGLAASTKVENITYWNMWSGFYTTWIDKYVAQFNASHPGIHVTALSIPSTTGDEKLLSAIAAGDPPSVFTEWNPVIGTYAQQKAIQPLNQYLTGKYAESLKWLNPVAATGGEYKGKLYGFPMNMNSYMLYYNKAMLKAAGISSPPTTAAQLFADQAKEWKFSGSRLEQMGFYPNADWDQLAPVWNVTEAKGDKYILQSSSTALALMNWIAKYKQYPFSAVSGLEAAVGQIGGGAEDPFVAGKAGFLISGMWEMTDLAQYNPSLQYGVVPIPPPPGGRADTSYINGNYNVIPKGAPDPKAAIQFITWMAGYGNASLAAKADTVGVIPPNPGVAKNPNYATFIARNPLRKLFTNIEFRPTDETAPVTTNESEFENAMGTALTEVLSKKWVPAKALSYVDAQANRS